MKLLYYHGTSTESCNEILKKGFLKQSIGDDHWLGDGCYFYQEEEYAFRWIFIKYKKLFSNVNSFNCDRIFEKYSIVSVDLDEKCRFFSLDKPNERLFFIRIKKELEEKAEHSERFSVQIKKSGIVDGVVINILFEYMGFNKKYEAVKAMFPIGRGDGDSRLDYLPEEQICVKDICVIKNIKKYNNDEVPEKYKHFMNEYTMTKNILRKSMRDNKVKQYEKRINTKYTYK